MNTTAPRPFLVDAILARIDGQGLDPEVFAAVRTCMRTIVRHPASLDALVASLRRRIDQGPPDSMVTRARVLLTRLERECDDRLPVPLHPETFGPASTDTTFRGQRAATTEDGTETWVTLVTETDPERAFGTLDNFRNYDGAQEHDRYRVIEHVETREPVQDHDADEVVGATYHVEGLYGRLANGARTWQRWQTVDTLRTARSVTGHFRRTINPRTTERTSPTAARLRRVTTVETVVERAA